MDTLAHLATMEAGDLPDWMAANRPVMAELRRAIAARSDAGQGITQDEVRALAFVMELAEPTA